jgi:release factor glutamine methyltransferase
MSETTWTVGRVLTWAADDFRGRGIESARLDAELLLAHVLGCDRIRLIIDNLRPLSNDELVRFRALIQRRRRGEPIAYILGRREFFGLSFRVDARVLVPRPDTETLLNVALERSVHRDQFGTLLDLCTGSGCVAVCFALERPTWQVWASDLSHDAIAVARENALRLGAPQVAFRRRSRTELMRPMCPLQHRSPCCT